VHGAPWSIKTAEPVVDPGEQAAEEAEGTTDKTLLPANFGINLANFNILNWLRTKRFANKKALATMVAENIQRKKLPELSDPEFQRLLKTVKPIETIVLNNVGEVDVLYKSLSNVNDTIDANSINSEAAITKLYMPSDVAGESSQQAASWQSIATEFQIQMNAEEAKARAVAPTMTPAAPIVGNTNKRTVKAQIESIPISPEQPIQTPGATPLSTEKYNSVRELTEDLLAMGPNPDTYNKLMSLVNRDDQDSVKEALSKFFQGSPTSICFLYGALVDVGMASAIDHEIVERIMEQHPNLDKENKQASFEGLFLPPLNASLNSMEKTAGRLTESYVMYGCKDNRMCPKTRNLVSTYICRFHCLDGLAVDDTQILCGEAIWRGNIMDKFSREYKDKDGTWMGGYIRKRFQVDQNDGGHPYQLKPGQRQRPIAENAWSPEKRLQELRRSESEKREYCETPGDPKNLYNFDPYEIKKGPEDPNLFIKQKDKISKLAARGEPKDPIDSKLCLVCNRLSPRTASFCIHCKSPNIRDHYTTENKDTRNINVSDPDMPSTISIKAATDWMPDAREQMLQNVDPKVLFYVDIQNGQPAVISYQPGAVGEVEPANLKPEGAGMPMGPFNSDEEANAALSRMMTNGIGTKAFNLTNIKTAKKSETSFNRSESKPSNIEYEAKPVLTCVAGIYRAEKGNYIDFGDTENQALRRLADLADLKPKSIDQESNELEQFMSENEAPAIPSQPRIPAPMPPTPTPSRIPVSTQPAASKQEQAPLPQNIPATGLPTRRFDNSMIPPPPMSKAEEEAGEEAGEPVSEQVVQDTVDNLNPDHPIDSSIIGSQIKAQIAEDAGSPDNPHFTAEEAMEEFPAYGLGNN